MNVPKLRFGEFVEDWKCKNLGDIAQFSKGKGIAKADISKDGQFECIRYGELYTQYKETIKQVISRTNLSANELVFSEANDVIIPASGETQLDIATASCVLKKGVALGGDLNIIKSDANGVFLSYYLNNAKKQSIANLAQGISVVHLYASQLKTLELNIPEIEEQQKIADFLSAVDEKITALTAQKTALTQYKQGMMQRIFAQTLRFKDDNGADYPDWEKKALGEISLFITNGLALEQNQEQSGYKVTRIETISDKKINLNKVGYVETEQDISDYKLYVGDILLSNINSISHIGKVVYVDDDYDLYHGMNLLRISIMKEKHDSKFVFFQLSTPHMKQEFETKANKAVNQASINQTEIKKLILQVPSLAEQTKVAQFLTECDDKINAVDAQIQSAQQWKQGLLQQMFV